MTDRIVVDGIRVDGRHGLVSLGERERPQPFVVDVEARLDLAPVAAADDITKALDYRSIVAVVRDVVEGGSFELVETLAEAIASRLLTLGADSVRVRVAKPAAAAAMGVAHVSVEVERPS